VAGLGVYRQLLANRPLTKLLIGEFISGIGDWLYIVAIFVVIYRETGDAALVGLFGAVRVIPYILLSVPAGLIADRFERRLVLLVSDIWRGSMMVILTILVVLNAPVVLVAAVAILATCGSAFFYPAMGAYMPSLVTDERQLGPANSAWASLQNISFILGPAIGGLLLALGGVTAAFVLNALTFIVIAVILWTLPSSARVVAVSPAASESAETTPGGPAHSEALAASETADAASDAETADRDPNAVAATPASKLHVARRPLLGLAIVQATAGFIDTGMQVLTVVIAINVLNAGEAANGYLNAAIGIGGLLGALASGILVLRRQLGPPLLIATVVFGLGLLLLGEVPVLVVALVALAIAYAGAIIIDVVQTTIFQRVVPDELRGRWTGAFMTLNTLFGAAGAIAMPILVVNVGAAPTLGTAGLVMIVLTIGALFLIGPAATRDPSPFEAVLAEVAKLPLFAGVPASRLEAALHRMHEVPVKAAEVVIRQGEPADRFYMIESGAFVVTIQDTPGTEPRVVRSLGPNEVFGELGLLNRSPRTATVTAETDGVLLALAGRDFLRLVGAGGELRSRLLSRYVSGPSSTD
jgi:MFS family permease